MVEYESLLNQIRRENCVMAKPVAEYTGRRLRANQDAMTSSLHLRYHFV